VSDEAMEARRMSPDQWVLVPLWYVIFLFSVTCHEAAHAYMAHLGGDSTAYLGGQVTLNPIPHMQREPFGTILVPVISFLWAGWMMGWASAPYDPLWADRHPRRAAAMAAAGPAANLILALIALTLLKIGLSAGVWQPSVEGTFRFVMATEGSGGVFEGAGRFLSILFGLNLLLFLFNLIPVPPLDGSAVAAGLFEPARRFRDQLNASGFGIMGILVAWLVIGRLFGPIRDLFLTWLYA
jgi:Zn-dependent protease